MKIRKIINQLNKTVYLNKTFLFGDFIDLGKNDKTRKWKQKKKRKEEFRENFPEERKIC